MFVAAAASSPSISMSVFCSFYSCCCARYSWCNNGSDPSISESDLIEQSLDLAGRSPADSSDSYAGYSYYCDVTHDYFGDSHLDFLTKQGEDTPSSVSSGLDFNVVVVSLLLGFCARRFLVVYLSKDISDEIVLVTDSFALPIYTVLELLRRVGVTGFGVARNGNSIEEVSKNECCC